MWLVLALQEVLHIRMYVASVGLARGVAHTWLVLALQEVLHIHVASVGLARGVAHTRG